MFTLHNELPLWWDVQRLRCGSKNPKVYPAVTPSGKIFNAYLPLGLEQVSDDLLEVII